VSERMPVKKLWDYAIEMKEEICTEKGKGISIVEEGEGRCT